MKTLFLSISLSIALLASTAASADRWFKPVHHHHHYPHGHTVVQYYPRPYQKVINYYPKPPVYRQVVNYYPPLPIQRVTTFYPAPQPRPHYYSHSNVNGLAGGVIGSVFGYSLGGGDPLATGLGAAAGTYFGGSWH